MSNGDLRGRRAVVTGGGSGIGRETALQFARSGADVVVIGRRRAPLEETRSLVDGEGCVVPVEADVADEDSVSAAFGQIDDAIGGCDILVNCAGAFGGGPITEMSPQEWRQVLDVNLFGTYLCSREAFRRMVIHGGGRIINVASIAGLRPRSNSTAYSASKAAVQGFSRALALEGRGHGISVTVVNPGNTAVERRSGGATSTGDFAGSEPLISTTDVARTIVLAATLEPGATLLDAT